MAAPDPGHLVEHRLRGVRVLEHVPHREIRHDVGVHEDSEGERDEPELQQCRRSPQIHQRPGCAPTPRPAARCPAPARRGARARERSGQSLRACCGAPPALSLPDREAQGKIRDSETSTATYPSILFNLVPKMAPRTRSQERSRQVLTPLNEMHLARSRLPSGRCAGEYLVIRRARCQGSDKGSGDRADGRELIRTRLMAGRIPASYIVCPSSGSGSWGRQGSEVKIAPGSL